MRTALIIIAIGLVSTGCALVGSTVGAISRDQAIVIAQRSSESLGPTRVLEVQAGPAGQVGHWLIPSRVGNEPADDFRTSWARQAWLVALVGTYPSGCPDETPCALEGREEFVVDAVTGTILARTIMAPLSGGIIPPPHDTPCGPQECGP